MKKLAFLSRFTRRFDTCDIPFDLEALVNGQPQGKRTSDNDPGLPNLSVPLLGGVPSWRDLATGLIGILAVGQVPAVVVVRCCSELGTCSGLKGVGE